MKIEIMEGNLMECGADAIVNPANSGGLMGGGVAGVIRRVSGEEVEVEAMRQAPIPIGTAILTSGGGSRFQGIIHAPTMVLPMENIPIRNVSKATRAALDLAERKRFSIVGFPGMGTGVGRVVPDDAAEAMIDVLRSAKGDSLQKVILVDISKAMVAAWWRRLTGEDRPART